jgi:hypothetical protein
MEGATAALDLSGLRPSEELWVDVVGLQFRSFLKEARDTLRAAAARRPPGDEVRVVKELEPRLGPPFHRFIRLLNQVPVQIPAGRIVQVRRRLKELLLDLLLPAPIYRQSLLKPLGYAGDYVTMNIAYTDHYQGETAYAKYLNRMFCDLAVSRAAISRLDYLRQWIGFTVHDNRSARTRILSVACGPAREVRDYLSSTALKREVVFSLADQDVRALAFAQAELAPYAGPGRPARVEAVNAPSSISSASRSASPIWPARTSSTPPGCWTTCHPMLHGRSCARYSGCSRPAVPLSPATSRPAATPGDSSKASWIGR